MKKMGLLEERQADKRWLENRIKEYNRLDDAYDAVKAQKDLFEQNVRSARKDVFKDGWFKGSYDWKGATYSSFEAFGEGDVKKEIDSYYNNGTNSLNDVLDALNDAKLDIRKRIRNRFGFGLYTPFSNILDWLATEIGNLLN